MRCLSYIANACLPLICAAGVQAQSIVLTNAEVYTVNPARDWTRDWAEAIAIDENGIITAVGTETQVLAAAPADATVVDLGGRMVLPGFQDVHLHAIEAGTNERLCPFDAFDTLAGHHRSLRHCIAETPLGDWVLGANVNMAHLLELHQRPIDVLDALAPDQPVLILDDIGHGAWVNSAALRAAELDGVQPDRDGNIILRDQAGLPIGVVLENAPHLFRNLAFPPTPQNLDFCLS